MAESITNGVRQEGGDVSGSAGNWGPIVPRALVSDVIAAAGAKNIEVTSQTGETDNLTTITGVTIGTDVRVQPTNGDTITVKDGSPLILQGGDFTMDDVNDVMTLHCISANVLKEITRSDNS